MDTSGAGLFATSSPSYDCDSLAPLKKAAIMHLEDETEKPLDKIDRAIQQSSQELKRLSELYRLRGKSSQAQQIDETLNRLAKRTESNPLGYQ